MRNNLRALCAIVVFGGLIGSGIASLLCIADLAQITFGWGRTPVPGHAAPGERVEVSLSLDTESVMGEWTCGERGEPLQGPSFSATGSGRWIIECSEYGAPKSNIEIPRSASDDAEGGVEFRGRLVVPADARPGVYDGSVTGRIYTYRQRHAAYAVAEYSLNERLTISVLTPDEIAPRRRSVASEQLRTHGSWLMILAGVVLLGLLGGRVLE